MSNIIDSIQLSGVTYDIVGSGGGGVPESAFTAYTAATDARIAEDEEVTAAGLNTLNDRLSEDEEVTAAALNELNEAISGISGNNVVELTQAEYDALVTGGTVDPTAFYIITDATAVDLTQYWTSAQTQSAITSATSDFITSEDVCSIASECGFVDAEGVDGILDEGGYLTSGDLSDNQALDDAVGGMGYTKKDEDLWSWIYDEGFVQKDEDLDYWIGEQGYTKKDIDLWDWIYNEGFVQQGDLEETLYNYVQTSAITSAVTSASTNSQIPSAKAVYDAIQEGGGGSSYTAGDGINITNNVISVTGKADTSAVTAIQDSLSGYVTTDTEQIISGRKIFTYTASSGKAIEFKQTSNSAKVGFSVKNTADTNNEVASFEFRPNTFTIDNVQHPLMYFGHYRNTNTANAGVPQTVIGFRQYDQLNAAAYHYLMPLPEKAKTPFSLTTSFKDYYAPIGFKNGSTMITTDNTGVVDFSNILGGLKLVKLTQVEYDLLTTKDDNTVYFIGDSNGYIMKIGSANVSM